VNASGVGEGGWEGVAAADGAAAGGGEGWAAGGGEDNLELIPGVMDLRSMMPITSVMKNPSSLGPKQSRASLRCD
jgi:hypothetical protein